MMGYFWNITPAINDSNRLASSDNFHTISNNPSVSAELSFFCFIIDLISPNLQVSAAASKTCRKIIKHI